VHSIHSIPEIKALAGRRSLVRIPPELDVPMTARVRNLVDTAPFRRLRNIAQLGLVPLVYPAANHTRFEHSLGVYRLALVYLQQFASDERFVATVSPEQAETFIIAALLHDLGHWPLCHTVEDLGFDGIPSHEELSSELLHQSEIASILRSDWNVEPESIATLLCGKPEAPAQRILSSLLSGPVDIDKMDYLQRDSLHAGVPYGRHFDQSRLVGSLCLNEAGDGLAITDKGKTAAELMVFARYVMFSEVYWHHAARSATVMFQRAFHLLYNELDLLALFQMTDAPFAETLLEKGTQPATAALLDGLFGPRRTLYKRLAEYSVMEAPEIYSHFTRRPYHFLIECSERMAELLSARLGQPVAPHEVLFDAQPTTPEVQFDVEVHYPKQNTYRRLGEVSPVTLALATEQFDSYVKRVRIFVHPRLAEAVGELKDLDQMLLEL